MVAWVELFIMPFMGLQMPGLEDGPPSPDIQVGLDRCSNARAALARRQVFLLLDLRYRVGQAVVLDGPVELRLEKLQIGDAPEVPVPRDQRQVVRQGRGGDPEVVVRDQLALTAKLGTESPVHPGNLQVQI